MPNGLGVVTFQVTREDVASVCVPIVAQVCNIPLTVFWLRSWANASMRRLPKRWLLFTVAAVLCMRSRSSCMCCFTRLCPFLHLCPFQTA